MLSAAKNSARAARAAMARVSRPGDPHVVTDPSMAWAVELAESRKKRLLRMQGVVGVGLGFRVREGMLTNEPCLTVAVGRKLPDKVLAKLAQPRLPKFVRSGKRILPLDVLQIGRVRTQAAVGDEIGPAARKARGTLGSLAVDDASGATVAITAMHVSGRQTVPTASVTSVPFCLPSRLSANSPPLFADLVLGTTRGVDAAKLVLRDQTSPVGSFRGQAVRGWRPLVYPGDVGTIVYMRGAVSGLQEGYIVNTGIDIPSGRIQSGVLVNIFSEAGDSGACIFDRDNFVLGFLKGAGDSSLKYLRVFCPAGLVLASLQCDIPATD